MQYNKGNNMTNNRIIFENELVNINYSTEECGNNDWLTINKYGFLNKFYNRDIQQHKIEIF